MTKYATNIIQMTVFLLASFVVKSNVWGKPRNYQIHSQAYKPGPTPSIENDWLTNMYHYQEVYLIEQMNDFVQYLQNKNWANSKLNWLKSMMTSQLQENVIAELMSFYRISGVTKMFWFGPEIQSQMSKQELSDLYQYLLLKKRAPFHWRFSDLMQFEQMFKLKKIEPIEMKKMIPFLYQIEGSYFLFVSPTIWSKLPIQLKQEFIREKLKTNLFNYGLRLQIELKNEKAINEIANDYAYLNNADQIRDYLQRTWREGNRFVDLNAIMNDFIHDHIYQYSSNCGANCMNHMLQLSGQIEKSKTNTFDFLGSMTEKYELQFIAEGDYRVGDILVYPDTDGEVKHTAVIVGQNLVYTKNGVSRFIPGLYQELSQMKKAYQISEEDPIYVYRPISPVKRHSLNSELQLQCRDLFL